jgi:hypothetical protein
MAATNDHAPASRRQLRQFGGIVGGGFALLGVLPWALRRGEPRPILLGLGALLALGALAWPEGLRWPHRAWTALGHVLGWINTRILLGVVFYLVVTPIGAVARLFGRDPMRRRFDPKASSYRQDREARPGTHMRQPF